MREPAHLGAVTLIFGPLYEKGKESGALFSFFVFMANFSTISVVSTTTTQNSLQT